MQVRKQQTKRTRSGGGRPCPQHFFGSLFCRLRSFRLGGKQHAGIGPAVIMAQRDQDLLRPRGQIVVMVTLAQNWLYYFLKGNLDAFRCLNKAAPFFWKPGPLTSVSTTKLMQPVFQASARGADAARYAHLPVSGARFPLNPTTGAGFCPSTVKVDVTFPPLGFSHRRFLPKLLPPFGGVTS